MGIEDEHFFGIQKGGSIAKNLGIRWKVVILGGPLRKLKDMLKEFVL